MGAGARFANLVRMYNKEARLQKAASVTMAWAAGIITIGIVFTILCACGVFPTSVSNMKAVDLFAPYLAKYIIYIVAGALTVVAVLMLYGEVLRHGRATPAGLLVMWLGIAATLATIGLNIYLLTEGSKLGAAWWNYLVDALILAMRLAMLLSSLAMLVAVHDAGQSEEARQTFLQGGY